jgi:predicted transposase YdaD
MEYKDIRDAVLFAEERAEKRGEKCGISIGEKRGISIGEKRGISIGEERGISIGEKRGISIGDKRNRTEFAIKCYRKGMSIAEIADLTDLSMEEVKEIVGKLS